MRFVKIAILICCVLCICDVRTEETMILPQHLTLKDAKKIAMQNNPNLQTILARIKAAMAQIEQARAEYMPVVDLVFDGKRVFNSAEELKSYSHVDAYTRYSTQAEISYKLYDGLAREYHILTTEQERDIANANLIDFQRHLLLSVSTAYYSAMLERQNVIINSDDFLFNKRLQEQAEKRLRHGTGNKSDVLNFEIQAQNAESERVMSELSYKVGLLALAELLGASPEELPADLTLDDVEDYTKASPILDYATLCDYALNNRPDMKVADLTIKQKDAMTKIYRSENLPKVTLYGNYGFAKRHDMKYTDDQTDAVIGIQATWNLFNGFQTEAKVSMALAERMEEEANRLTLKQSILHEVSRQIQTIEYAKKLADLKNNTQKLAMQARDLVQKEYDIGRVTSTRLNEAQNDLTNAQGDYVKAVINYWLYRENLDATTNRIIDFE